MAFTIYFSYIIYIVNFVLPAIYSVLPVDRLHGPHIPRPSYGRHGLTFCTSCNPPIIISPSAN